MAEPTMHIRKEVRIAASTSEACNANKDTKEYLFPNDKQEKDRLDMQHHILQLTLDNKLHNAPLEKGKIHRALDVGTGTGIWAIDFADEHPETEVIGIDLSPIQPAFTAPNCTFQIDDLQEPWTFPHKFDYLYARMMTGSFTDWPRFFRQCYENLNSGGFVELCDITCEIQCDDGSLPEDNITKRFYSQLLNASRKIEKPLDSALLYSSQLVEAGFIEINNMMYRWPVNTWPKDQKHKEIGLWTQGHISYGIAALAMALCTRVLGMTKEETEVQLALVRKDIKNTKVHSYVPLYVHYARKPL